METATDALHDETMETDIAKETEIETVIANAVENLTAAATGRTETDATVTALATEVETNIVALTFVVTRTSGFFQLICRIVRRS